MALLQSVALSLGLSIISWIAIISIGGEQPIDRLLLLLLGWAFVVWGL